MKTHIMLVEDDERLAELTAEYLRKNDFEVAIEPRGDVAEQRILQENPELVILDVMLPGKDGFEVCRGVRSRYKGVILMLTARDEDLDQILGLELGADDYVPKPCTPRELSARLRAILRRTLPKQEEGKEAEGDAVRIGELVLLPAQRRITWANETLALTNAEYNLLEVLIQKAGQVVSKDLLSEQGLGRPHERYDRSIDVHLSSVRRKLPPLPDGRSRIQAVFRRGYQLLVD